MTILNISLGNQILEARGNKICFFLPIMILYIYLSLVCIYHLFFLLDLCNFLTSAICNMFFLFDWLHTCFKCRTQTHLLFMVIENMKVPAKQVVKCQIFLGCLNWTRILVWFRWGSKTSQEVEMLATMPPTMESSVNISEWPSTILCTPPCPANTILYHYTAIFTLVYWLSGNIQGWVVAGIVYRAWGSEKTRVASTSTMVTRVTSTLEWGDSMTRPIEVLHSNINADFT